MIKLITFSAIIITIFLLAFISSYSIKKPFVKYIVISLLAHSLIFSYINVMNTNNISLYSYDGKLADKSSQKRQHSKQKLYKENKITEKISKIEGYNNEIIFLREEKRNKQNNPNSNVKNKSNVKNIKPSNQKKLSQQNKPYIERFPKNTRILKQKSETEKDNYTENKDTLTDTWLNENNKLERYVYKREKPFYLIDPNKTGWQKFNFDLSLLGDNNKFSIRGFDEFTHKNYMQHILETVGYKWFYQYAPTEQIALNIMEISTPITVQFDLDKKGSIENLTFIQKGSVKLQTEAVNRTFKTVKLEKVPDTLLYRNINMRFIIYPPIKKKNKHIYIKGEIQINGEVKIDR